MRVSFESGVEITSLCAGSAAKSRRQQPTPTMVTVVVVVDAEPLRNRLPWRSARPRLTLLRGQRILVHGQNLVAEVHVWGCGVQRRRVGHRPDHDLGRRVIAAVPVLGFVASGAALELRKYSVPPFDDSKEPVPGDCAGQTVNPGWVAPVSLGAFDHARGVDVLHGHVRRARGKLRLRERVDLRSGESVAAPRVGVRRDVEPVRVCTDMRVVAEIWAGLTPPVFVPSFVTSSL
jgi:hypothetical protein